RGTDHHSSSGKRLKFATGWGQGLARRLQGEHCTVQIAIHTGDRLHRKIELPQQFPVHAKHRDPGLHKIPRVQFIPPTILEPLQSLELTRSFTTPTHLGDCRITVAGYDPDYQFPTAGI